MLLSAPLLNKWQTVRLSFSRHSPAGLIQVTYE